MCLHLGCLCFVRRAENSSVSGGSLDGDALLDEGMQYLVASGNPEPKLLMMLEKGGSELQLSLLVSFLRGKTLRSYIHTSPDMRKVEGGPTVLRKVGAR